MLDTPWHRFRSISHTSTAPGVAQVRPSLWKRAQNDTAALRPDKHDIGARAWLLQCSWDLSRWRGGESFRMLGHLQSFPDPLPGRAGWKHRWALRSRKVRLEMN